MIVYATTIWTHHQSALCRELHNLLGDEFKMVISMPLEHALCKERMAMGWDLIPPKEDWIVGPPLTFEEARATDYMRWIVDSEVAILGWIPYVDESLINRRIRTGKITLFQGERLFKEERRWFDYLNPRVLKRWAVWSWRFHHRNVYYLTLSHWCREDLRFLRGCKGRIFRWGYLTCVDEAPPRKTQNDRVRIGWCGRMLELKNVNHLIEAVARLPEDLRRRCEVEIVGNGEEEVALKDLVRQLQLEDIVRFSESVSSSDALAFMRSLDVYVFPSNRQEGWGAVILEAMNAGCAVVASTAAGATLDLIENGVNGFTFEVGDVDGLVFRLAELISSLERCRAVGFCAWKSVREWSPKIGALRLLSLIRAIVAGGDLRLYSGLGELVG